MHQQTMNRVVKNRARRMISCVIKLRNTLKNTLPGPGIIRKQAAHLIRNQRLRPFGVQAICIMHTVYYALKRAAKHTAAAYLFGKEKSPRPKGLRLFCAVTENQSTFTPA
jgi:hypothetical protein